MRLKKFGALLLAGAMITGTIGVMSPTEAKAATPANTYTMTVPANMEIQNSGWNSLGDIQITGPVDSLKKVTVTASTTNNFNLVDGTNSVSYTMKTAENGSEQKSFEFAAASINADGGASQAIGVDVADFAGKPAGTYKDTITFTGTMTEALAWSEDDWLYVYMENDEYQLNFDYISLESGSTEYIKYDKNNSQQADPYPLVDLKISGNVFTFTCEDVEFELDFSNKTYQIKGDSSYKFTYIKHYEKSTDTSNVWLNNLPQ